MLLPISTHDHLVQQHCNILQETLIPVSNHVEMLQIGEEFCSPEVKLDGQPPVTIYNCNFQCCLLLFSFGNMPSSLKIEHLLQEASLREKYGQYLLLTATQNAASE